MLLVSRAATRVVENAPRPGELAPRNFVEPRVVPVLATRGRSAATKAVVLVHSLDKDALKSIVALLVDNILAP